MVYHLPSTIYHLPKQLSKADQRLVYNCKYLLPGFGINHGYTGKAAESGQDRIFFPKIKAWKTQGLLTCTLDPNARMNMAREKIGNLIAWIFSIPFFPILVIADVVNKVEMLPRECLPAEINTCIFVPVVFQNIMIPPDQTDIDIREI